MGRTDIELSSDPRKMRLFTKKLLNDLRALEKMLSRGMFEKDIRRIGAEQEFFLVNRQHEPAPVALEMLDLMKDPHFTHELARFNLEMNLEPVVYSGKCLTQMEEQIKNLHQVANQAARSLHCDIAYSGILPSIRKKHLAISNITPLQRYYALNNAILDFRGEDYEIRIKGLDELTFNHNSVMLEACNTSFQVHFQVTPEEFAELYNWAQLVTGPVLAAATNSPILLGKRLWHETRIALFQQAVDTRGKGHQHREREPRVWFGNRWVRDSILDVFREDISRFRALFGIETDEDPFELIKKGQAPELESLRLHSGTIYRWNRPCYGVQNGKPHLRIENRVLPAGPTIQDSIANMAFFFGLMSWFSHNYQNVGELIDFDHAKNNFFSAARHSLDAQFQWVGGKTWPARELILKELIPLAYKGLESSDVDQADANRFLGILESRVSSGQTGSTWMLKSLEKMGKSRPRDVILTSLTAGMVCRQSLGVPVHEWTLMDQDEILDWNSESTQVDQVMNTNLFTVHEDDLIDLVADVMHWQKIRQVAVENRQGHLVGIVSYRDLLKHFGRYANEGVVKLVPIRSIMKRNPFSLHADASLRDVINLMREKGVSAIPIVEGKRLLGMITEQELFDLAAKVFEDKYLTN